MVLSFFNRIINKIIENIIIYIYIKFLPFNPSDLLFVSLDSSPALTYDFAKINTVIRSISLCSPLAIPITEKLKSNKAAR